VQLRANNENLRRKPIDAKQRADKPQLLQEEIRNSTQLGISFETVPTEFQIQLRFTA
jgi:hypothetical protein